MQCGCRKQLSSKRRHFLNDQRSETKLKISNIEETPGHSDNDLTIDSETGSEIDSENEINSEIDSYDSEDDQNIAERGDDSNDTYVLEGL